MTTTPNAKINLGLRVCGLRPDGYHDIETVFLPYFGLCDSLEIVRGDDFSRTLAGLISKYGGPSSPIADEISRDGSVSTGETGGFGAVGGKIRQGITRDGKCMITVACEEGVDWNPQEDLCVRAYTVLDEDFSLPPVKIILEKGIPVGAGLGGGSSDGAFALKTLSEMFGLGLDAGLLSEYASRLGSDCAFFLHNRPMLGEGRGEILTPVEIPQLDDYEIQVAVPQGIRINTATAYRNIDGEAGSSPLNRTPLRSAALCSVEEWKDLIVNDFEKPVFAQHPQLAAIRQSLYDCGATFVSMSGTGPAVYGVFPKH